MTISERLFDYMDKNRITQAELAKGTGINPAVISDWRRKGTNPSANKIISICRFLELNTDWLLTGEISPSTNETVQINNGIAFNRNSSVTMHQPPKKELTKEKEEILNIYDKLNLKGRHSLLTLLINLEQNPEYADV
ncbi:MAG: helix-turn-helix domain-containing protein [Turicibacter sp.]|nr:helix-turn-helix domain-containing protein [Turicibacter sp.]